jgi:hypothetical protein
MSNKQCNLPDGSFHNVKKNYEEISIPAQRAPPLTRMPPVLLLLVVFTFSQFIPFFFFFFFLT